MTKLERGHILRLGRYEQGRGPEPIEWVVLRHDTKLNRATVISRYGLDARPFHHAEPYPTWVESDIRAWLNDAFLHAAFTEAEQQAILPQTVVTQAFRDRDGGAFTQDRIWLLSREEAKTYFQSDADRRVYATAYAKANGAEEAINGCCPWWTRSPGIGAEYASRVAAEGFCSSFCFVSYKNAVRPAMVVDVSALPRIELTEDEKFDSAAKYVLNRYRSAFEELAK